MKWQLRAGQHLRTLAGDDESVLYNDHSGETHLLSAIAVGVLLQLRVGPQDVAAVSSRLAQDWEFESDAELSHMTSHLLSDLDGLGLIEPCIP